MQLNLYKIVATSLTLVSFAVYGQTSEKLVGIPIGTPIGFQYEPTPHVVENIQHYAFDGDASTYFATDQRSYGWVGLDLGEPYVITRAGWMPRNDGVGPDRVVTAVLQGANSEDFMDAVPLYIITERGVIGQMTYDDISCSRGFRYVRFVSKGDARCNIAELEFYGYRGEGDDNGLYQFTNLPTVVINTVNAEEPFDKETSIESNVIIIDEGRVNLEASAGVRERGNASRSFPKKPWRIKFDKKQTPLNATAKAKKWTLINNYGDKTLMRNIVAFEIARRLDMAYVPYARPVDVVLNGEYKGCYQLCDQVEVNKNRVNINEMEPTDIEGEALTGGYFFEIDAYADQEPQNEWFYSPNRYIPITIKSPDDGGTTEQYNYLRNYFGMLETRLFTNDFADEETGYRSMFDIESFLQHFIVGEVSGNTDTYWSTYMYKHRGSDIIYTGPVWDFDIAFDNDSRTYPLNKYNTYLYASGVASAANGMRRFVDRIIFEDPKTADDISRMWSKARNHADLSAESLCEFIDNMTDQLDRSQTLNFMRWPIMNDYVHMNPAVFGSYEGEVNSVKRYLTNRFTKLDKLMNYVAETGIEDVSVDVEANGVCEIYNLSGIKVAETIDGLSGGIYIVKQGDTVKKIVKR